MRAFDRDLIRGGHYGQRPCEPHLKAEHMAAPTNAANVKKVLVNSEPSTHGTNRTCPSRRPMSAYWGKADIQPAIAEQSRFMSTWPPAPFPTFVGDELARLRELPKVRHPTAT